MYHVVVAVDEHAERARRQAREVAGLPQAADEVRATLLHVFTDASDVSAAEVGAVKRAEETLASAGVEVAVDGRSGEPAATVLDTAERVGADCICVGGRRQTPNGRTIFGDVAQSVILQADRPVFVTDGIDDR